MNTTLPQTARKGDWMQTYSGVQFWPLDPRPGEIRLVDIAHALAHTCRFGGHCKEFYSVAQHSVHVARMLADDPIEVQISGLMHDATEAYLVDVPRPIKSFLTNYTVIEDALASVIRDWFRAEYGLALDFNHPRVKWADNRALATEARDVMGPKPAPWNFEPEPDTALIRPAAAFEAESMFYCMFDELVFPLCSKPSSQTRV